MGEKKEKERKGKENEIKEESYQNGARKRRQRGEELWRIYEGGPEGSTSRGSKVYPP